MPEFDVIIAGKKFRIFFLGGGARALPAHLSYAYDFGPGTAYFMSLLIYFFYASCCGDDL